MNIMEAMIQEFNDNSRHINNVFSKPVMEVGPRPLKLPESPVDENTPTLMTRTATFFFFFLVISTQSREYREKMV